MYPLSRRFVGEKPLLVFDLPLTSRQENFDKISGNIIQGSGIVYENGYTKFTAQGSGSLNSPNIFGSNFDFTKAGGILLDFTIEYEVMPILYYIAWSGTAGVANICGFSNILNVQQWGRVQATEAVTSVYYIPLNTWVRVKCILDSKNKIWRIFFNDILISEVIHDYYITASYQTSGIPLSVSNRLWLLSAFNLAGAYSVVGLKNIKIWDGILN